MANDPAIPLTPSQRTGNWVFANSLALLLIRLALGSVFIYAGAGKLFGVFNGPGMEAWTRAMEGDALRMPVLPPVAWAYISAGGEFFGGIAVLLGVLTRLGALPLIVTMCVAIAKAVGKNGFGGIQSQTDQGAVHPGYGYNLALIAMAVALVVAGGGLISLDALIFKRGLWARGPQPLEQPAKRA